MEGAEDNGSEELFYSARSKPMIRLTEKYQRTAASAQVFRRFIRTSFAPYEFKKGTHTVTKEIGERMKSWSYVPLYEFSEGICEQKSKVSKRDIFDLDKIMPRSTEGVETLPLYFAPLFKMASRDLLLYSDFAESVDVLLTPMISRVFSKMTEHSIRERCGCFESREFHECPENLDPLISQLKNCQSTMSIDFVNLYQARRALKALSTEPFNSRLSSEVVNELYRLRDFCNYALTLYLNSVLKTTEVVNSLFEKKLLSI